MNMKSAIPFLCLSLFFDSFNAHRLPRQVIGGLDASARDHPYHVSLRYNNEHGCSGVIIGEQHVVTSAHCIEGVFKYPFNNCTVNAGTVSTKQVGHAYRIAGVTVHPNWKEQDGKYHIINDIAILKLVDKIRFDATQQKIGLATHNVVSGSKGIETGWAIDEIVGGKTHEKLQSLETTVLTKEDCTSRFNIGSRLPLHTNQFCTYQKKNHATGVGDSGGPIVVNNELVGIISGGIKIVTTAEVDIAMNIFEYKDFIRQAINK